MNILRKRAHDKKFGLEPPSMDDIEIKDIQPLDKKLEPESKNKSINLFQQVYSYLIQLFRKMLPKLTTKEKKWTIIII